MTSDALIKKLLASKPDFAEAIQNGEVYLKRYNSDPPRYELYWPEVGKDIPINVNGDELWSFATVQKAIFKVWKEVTDDMKPRDWHELLTILNADREDIDEPGASMKAEVLDMLERWIERFNTTVWSANDLNHQPLYKDGFYYFKITTLESQVLFAQNSRFYYQRYLIARPKLYQILKAAGAKSVIKNFKKNVIRVWEIPEGFNEPTEEAEGQLEPEDEDDSD